MDQYAVPECHGLAGRQREIPPLLIRAFEVGISEVVRAHETVPSHVPACRVARVARVVEYGDAARLAVNGSAVIAPGSAFAPRLRLADGPHGVSDLAVTVRIDDRVHPERRDTAFFRVTERHVPFRGSERNSEIDDTQFRRSVVEDILSLL